MVWIYVNCVLNHRKIYYLCFPNFHFSTYLLDYLLGLECGCSDSFNSYPSAIYILFKVNCSYILHRLLISPYLMYLNICVLCVTKGSSKLIFLACVVE